MTWTLHNTDCLEGLRQLPDNCVQTCVTSPPYWNLRDYGVDGQLGLEPTPEEYVTHMVEVFREVRRVLRDDGTLWLNLGDSFWAGGSTTEYGQNTRNFEDKSTLASHHTNGQCQRPIKPRKHTYLKPKDLVGIPWRVAFALQADGWYLRSDIIWHKPNPMPESVTDRPTKAHEYIFLLSKSERYYYDPEAVKEPLKRPEELNRETPARFGGALKHEGYGTRKHSGRQYTGELTGRNKRDVWMVPTHPFPEAHFATFPPKLIEPCILAGSRPGDIVLDPFAGAGTTLLVAEKYGRDSIGYELNPKYCDIIRNRLREVQTAMTLA